MKLYPSLSADLADWAQRQPVFFTGSAAIHGAHINVSPKGMADSHFAILGTNQCAYIDRTGSGCETISHAYENGRLCLMFMSFGETPRIMRLFCNARVVEYDQPEFQDLVARIARGKRDAFDGARAVIVADIWEVQTSCGYAVPRIRRAIYSPDDSDPEEPPSKEATRGGKPSELSVFENRPTLDKSLATKAEQGLVFEYHRKNNVMSLDRVPGLRAARRDIGQRIWLVDMQARIARVAAEKDALAVGFASAVLLYFLLTLLGLL